MSPATILQSHETHLTANGAETDVVCHCLGVTAMEVQAAIDTCAIQNVKEIGHCTGAGQGCNACHRRLRQMLRG